MEIKQNPFSVYDFLGYFTPGALFLFSLMAVYGYETATPKLFERFGDKLGFSNEEIYVFFVLLAYTTGHLLSFLSSVTVGRYSVWSHGYPSKYLLGIPHLGYFRVEERKRLRICIRAIIWVLFMPVTVLDYLIGKRLGFRDLYVKRLDSLLSQILLKKVCAFLIYHGDQTDPPTEGDAKTHDFFRYVYHYALENAPNHVPKMQNYVALYGFLRTLTLLSVFVFWGLIWSVFVGLFRPTTVSIAIPIVSIISFLLYTAFVKFYRRFSLEVLMAFASNYVITRGTHRYENQCKQSQLKSQDED